MKTFEVLNREEFIDKRWANYEKALSEKEEIARHHDVPESAIIIAEPPVNGEIICDVCNREVLDPQVFIRHDWLYCKQCVKEDSDVSTETN